MDLQQIEQTATYQAFTEKIISLKEQHLRFMQLAAGRNGAISDGYASLAANTLTTLILIDNLFTVFRVEFDNLDKDA